MRMRRALVDLIVQGVETSRDFHIRMMDDADFQRGDIDIQWLERKLPEILQRLPGAERTRIAAIAGALTAERERVRPGTSRAGGNLDTVPGAASADDPWKRAALIEGLHG